MSIAVSRVFHPLLFLLARCTKNQLIRQIEFLRAENEILRSRVPRVIATPAERARLMKLGREIGVSVKQLITVVTYQTYLKWIRKQKAGHVPRKIGRPRTDESIRDLIVKIASETGWGYTRVMGELKKLGVRPPSRSTVKRILAEHRLEPPPRGGPGTWAEFLRIHAETLWQCDFASKYIWTRSGFRKCLVLVFLHVGSRRVFVSPVCRKPDAAWMRSQAEAFVRHIGPEQAVGAIVRRDRDVIYQSRFDEALRAAGIQVQRTTYRSPNLQAHVERFIQSLQQEALDHFIVCGEKHFDHLVSEYVEHYHTERPHQAKGNVPLTGEWPEATGEPPLEGEVVCRERLGGLLKSYQRAAA